MPYKWSRVRRAPARNAVAADVAGCQVERRRVKGSSGGDEGTLRRAAGYLFYYLTFVVGGERGSKKVGREGGGRRGKKNHSWILFSTLRRATSGSVTLHLQRTIRLAKVHKNAEIPCHLLPDLFSRVTRRRAVREGGRRGGEGAGLTLHVLI